nr:hypothetical protein HK105_000991 [Polyrhizophydium stewartii]
MAKSELNADQVLAIQRKPEVTAIIKELEELARQTSIFDAENALRGQLDSFLLTWYALHSALPHVPASSGLSPAKLSALLSLKSALSGAGVPLAGLPALVAQARHHAELIAAASPAAVPGSTVSYAEISGVVADLVCPPPPPRFGSLVEPDSAETPHGTQDAPEADAHEQRPVARRAAAGISFFSPSEILGETAQSDESAALLAAAPPSVATPLGLDDQAELASGVEAEGEAQIADIAGDDGDQAPAPQPSADDAAEAVPNGEPAVRSDGRETSPSKAAASVAAAQPASDASARAVAPSSGQGHSDLETLRAELAGDAAAAPSLKDMLLGSSPDATAPLSAFLQERLAADMGETVLELGLEDDGSAMHLTADDFAACLERIRLCADKLNADATLLHRRGTPSLRTSAAFNDGDAALILSAKIEAIADDGDATTSGPSFGHVLVRQRAGKVEDLIELRICVVGNVDAGKSTLLGVLTKDTLDDGRGKARVNLFRHKHEIESGRTSSVGMEIMGYDSAGRIVTPSSLNKQRLNWDDICYQASKVITFLDLAGHEKYLKTTVFGMTGCSPDYVMLMVGANAGIIGMTKEHLGLALALQVPVFIVITKIDMCPKNVLESTINQLVKILKSPGCRKIPMFIRTVGDVLMASANFISERVCPVFQVSNVSGEGLDLLKLFLNLLHANSNNKYDAKAPVEYQITDTFSVPGVGTVVSGTVTSGIVHVGDTLLLGPDSTGQFVPTMVKSIQRKRVNTPCAAAGQSASFGLKKVKRSALRKGMVMVSKSLDPKAVMEFEAEILVLYHSTTISEKYQAMLHCGGVRQTARIVGMSKQILRTGDRAIVRFRFMQHPEYLKPGTRLLFREGRTKGIGKVVRTLTPEDLKAESTRPATAPAAPTSATSSACGVVAGDVRLVSGEDAGFCESAPKSAWYGPVTRRVAGAALHRGRSAQESKEAGLVDVLRSALHSLNLPKNIEHEAMSLFSRAQAELEIGFGRKGLVCMAVCLFIAIRLQTLPKTLSSVLDHFGIELLEFSRLFYRIRACVPAYVPRIDPEIYLPRLCAVVFPTDLESRADLASFAEKAQASARIDDKLLAALAASVGCTPSLAKLRLRECTHTLVQYASRLPFYSDLSVKRLHNVARQLSQILQFTDAMLACAERPPIINRHVAGSNCARFDISCIAFSQAYPDKLACFRRRIEVMQNPLAHTDLAESEPVDEKDELIEALMLDGVAQSDILHLRFRRTKSGVWTAGVDLADLFHCEFSAPPMPHGAAQGQSTLSVNIGGSLFKIPPSSTFLVSDFGFLPTLCKGKRFSAVLLDPPWPNKSVERSGSYDHMDCWQLKRIPIAKITDAGAIIAVWVTNKQKVHDLVKNRLFPAWGVELAAEWMWLKVSSQGEPVVPLDRSAPC